MCDVESHPFDLDTMLFMDWRDDHTADNPDMRASNEVRLSGILTRVECEHKRPVPKSMGEAGHDAQVFATTCTGMGRKRC